MTGDGTVRALTGLFWRFGNRRPDPDGMSGVTVSEAPADVVCPTKAFRTFLSCLSGRAAPALIDLGPVVGSNVEFFGDRLGCKIFVQDLLADLDELDGREGPDRQAFFTTRFHQASATIDGVLCWDVFDYVDRRSAETLARELVRVLKPGGALLAFFNATSGAAAPYTKYLIEDDLHLRHRPYGRARPKHRVLLNRDIIKLFGGLLVSDSFLLKSNTREILFRKPAIDRRG